MVEQTHTKVVDVAVGVIMRGTQVLISWRHAGQHQGNRYEFPGGKIDAGESPVAGLTRELKEELGIEVLQAIRAGQLQFAYPEKTVRLHIFKVTGFSGEPVGQEGQPVQWVERHELPNYQFPDANAPILRMVLLPEQYVICRERQAAESPAQWLHWHAQAVPQQAWLYVRCPEIMADEYMQLVQQLASQRPDLQLLVMSRHALRVADSGCAGVRGVHFSRQDLLRLQSLSGYPAAWFKVAACHDVVAIQQANQLGLDAVLLSPLHVTASHQQVAALGWDGWQDLCLQSHVPVYALGGVQPTELPAVQQRGGFGVAGIRAFMLPVIPAGECTLNP